MKILESRPHRYDWGINLLTAGQAGRVIDDIVVNFIRPGMSVLDVGCGTGDLAVKAAKADAFVTGLDISEGMLAIARERIKKNRLQDKVDFHHAGVVEVDTLFAENSFDCITSTLVISELYGEERRWALRELYRILKSDGTLIITGEVKPKQPLKRAIYTALRLPLALITYIISQTGTKAVSDINTEIRKAGFDITNERNSFLGSFVTIVAKKIKTHSLAADAQAMKSDLDKSAAKTLFDYCGRWFPNPVEPGLRILGTPDRTAPVIVTANFHLTVRRVEKALADQDCYLLVVPTKGINAWCASSGGEMNTHSIIAALKTSGIGERVDHRVLVLPQFSAPGIDIKLLKKRTGWNGKWGPAYARDLPSFLDNGYTKTPQQSLAQFPLSFRMEMLLSMNFSVWMVFAAIALVIHPAWALITSAIFWGTGLILYAAYPYLPFESGWLKALVLTIIVMAVFIVVSVNVSGKPWHYAGWMVFTCLAIMTIGFDLKGIVGDRTSEAEAFMHRLGFDAFGHLFRAKGVHKGCITQDKYRCINCSTCRMVCPMGVFGIAGNKKDVIIIHDSACLKCIACVRQCPKKALIWKD
jgi:ubiquinone/menaquinone biosynthesis C-methylase UbiE/NAD-dependent dihydropyrimidine dehydrogenase PreA subunit